ncbi:MAG: response regulator [Chloroflexia bacterium]|nr:response regulator [Chloroflexia bacterium]
MDKRTVLVVDDEPSIRDLIVVVLEEEGYRALAAGSGVFALHLVATEQPDLVLLDMMMPQMDGRETLRRLRQLPEGQTTPVVVMSAAVTAANVGDGVAAFIGKPFDLGALLETIAGILDGRSLGDSIAES